jgi:16S rRNA processing protein RimM
VNPVKTAVLAASSWPDDAVEVGRVLGAWGIKGWIKVQPFAADPQALLGADRWYLQPPEPGPQRGPGELTITQSRSHGDAVIAVAAECGDRNAAEALQGARVFVPRASFPAAQVDEYYWVDLIGTAVVNRQGERLGIVTSLLDTGAHSVLCVRSDDEPNKTADAPAERLIPFVAAYVDSVDLKAMRIVVDWGLDY